MKKYLTKEEVFQRLPYQNPTKINDSLIENASETTILNVCDDYFEGSKLYKSHNKLHVPRLLNDDFLIPKRPGLGYIKREKPKFIKFKVGQSVEFVNDEEVEDFKKENSYSMYIMKKWLTPDIDNFIKINIIRPRALNNWKKLYLGVVEKYLLKNRDIRYVRARYNIYKESYLRFKDSYYLLKDKYLEAQIKYDEIKEKITAIDCDRIKKIISTLKDELNYFRDEYMITNKMNEELYKKIINLSNIHFENTLRNAYKNKQQQDDYNRIIKTNRVMSILTAAIDPRLELSDKWFGFDKNKNLETLWSICNTPHWLINMNCESDVPEIIEIEREVVIEIIKISKFRRTKNGFNCLHFFLRRRNISTANTKGAEKFRQTFNKLFKFHEDFGNKQHQYAICIEYLVLFFYSKNIMNNFDYLMNEYHKKNKKNDFNVETGTQQGIYNGNYLNISNMESFEYSDHDVDKFILHLTDVSRAHAENRE